MATIEAKKNPPIVRKVSLTETLRAIAPGQSSTYDCREAGLYPSAQVAVTRLNQKAGYKEFRIWTTDNGVTYTVSRDHKT